MTLARLLDTTHHTTHNFAHAVALRISGGKVLHLGFAGFAAQKENKSRGDWCGQ
jgi:hypothetical protein